jgi:hypothetical protein
MRRILLPVLTLLLVACVTETTTVRTPNTPPRNAKAKPSPSVPAESNGKDEKIKLPPEIMKQLIAFVNRTQLLLADRIEVDVSRVPFQSAMIPVNDVRFVETVEMANTYENATGMLIRARSKRPLVERDFPRLRIGDGLELVANREIRVRTYSDIDRKRPVYLKIQGVGHAVYRDETTGKRIEKDAIAIRAEVVEGPDGLIFRSKVL